jgi:argininosuccinate lyase
MDLRRLIFECVDAKKGQLEQKCHENFSAITDLANALVQRDLSFREKHHAVGGVVQRAIDAGIDGSETMVETIKESAAQELDHVLAITPEFVPALSRSGAICSFPHDDGRHGTAEVWRMLAVLAARRAGDIDLVTARSARCRPRQRTSS